MSRSVTVDGRSGELVTGENVVAIHFPDLGISSEMPMTTKLTIIVRLNGASPETAEAMLLSIEFSGPIPGEFIVGFKHPLPTYASDGSLIDLGVEFVGPDFQDPALQSKFDAIGLDLQIDHFLGARHTVLVRAPAEVALAQLQEALAAIDGFDFVEHNVRGLGLM
jgi:hypothetical protein